MKVFLPAPAPSQPFRRGILLAAGFTILLTMMVADVSSAQEQPPDTPPESRLTVTPSAFDRWLGRTPAAGATTKPAVKPTTKPAAKTPRLGSPPAPPVLTAPPPPPSLPLPAGPTSVPPAPPKLDTPAKPPATAIIPPNSGSTSATAATATGRVTPPPEPVTIGYAAEATGLPAGSRRALDAFAVWLRDNPDVRIELLGYASESSRTGSRARRRSLLRVVAVRDYLVGKGVLSTRMAVRALGDQAEEEPRDRVEVRVPPS